ncbi:solute carrier family 22 member 21-like isoform X1 [Dunckerocampus dactyliophorus]|uniref:solute carrier family 22 member 21-like isoform X1 n=1 Tax=Dunckerocampus dactyliophorus TaxID=161453 RepID=UPI0024058EE8|nr:solute carrier family 22 member 21-like isoform X1 [Dunckerocampus dactyliophorus]
MFKNMHISQIHNLARCVIIGKLLLLNFGCFLLAPQMQFLNSYTDCTNTLLSGQMAHSPKMMTSTFIQIQTSKWELVCENAWKVPFSTSVFFVGVLFGALFSGQLSDRFGRKLVLYATIALHSVTALIQATSVNWLMFCVLNCVRGMGHASSYLASLVLGSEMLRPSVRVSYTLLGHSLGFGLGYALLPLFAYFLRGWRWLLVASAIPGLLWLLTWRVIPESPRWLLLRGQVEEAEMVLRRAAKLNKIHAPEVLFLTGEGSELLQKTGEKEQTYSYMDLINTANLRNITVIGVFIWMAVAMVFFGLSLNTSNLNGNIYLNCLISAAIDIVAYVSSWFLINRAPRPTLLFFTLMFSGAMLLVIKLIPDDMHVTFQVLVLVGKTGVSIAYCFIYMFFAELMPTVVRNTGLGILSSFARFGAIICPYVIYIGIYSKILPYIIFGSFSVMAALLSLLLPDTRNSKLPDLISEAKPIRSCCAPKKTLPATIKATYSQA